MTTKSLYTILGVDPSASKADIQSAYRRAAMRTHPDRDGGSDEAFKEVERAGKILLDDEARKRYDESGDDGSGTLPLAERVSRMVFDTIAQGMVIGDQPFHHSFDKVRSTVAEELNKLKGKRAGLQSRLDTMTRDAERLAKRRRNDPSKQTDYNFLSRIRVEVESRCKISLKAMDSDLEFLSAVADLLNDWELPQAEQPPAVVNSLEAILRKQGFPL